MGSALEEGLYWGGVHAAAPPPAGAGDKLVMVHGVACVYGYTAFLGCNIHLLFTLYHVAVVNQSRTNQANLIPYKFRYKCDKGVLSRTFASRTHSERMNLIYSYFSRRLATTAASLLLPLCQPSKVHPIL